MTIADRDALIPLLFAESPPTPSHINRKTTTIAQTLICNRCAKTSPTIYCKQCREIFYCNRTCQKKDWIFRKSSCFPVLTSTKAYETLEREFPLWKIYAKNYQNFPKWKEGLKGMANSLPFPRRLLERIKLAAFKGTRKTFWNLLTYQTYPRTLSLLDRSLYLFPNPWFKTFAFRRNCL